MPFVLWLLAVAAIVVGLAWWLSGLPGLVAISVAGLTIEAHTGVALVASIVLLGVVLAVLRVILAVLAWPLTWRRWRRERRRQRGDAAVSAALVALAAADPIAARREARRARDLLGDTAQTMLLDAEAARLAGRDGDAEAIYRTMAERADAAFLGLRGLFRGAIAREDWGAAADFARRAETAHPGAAWLREDRTMLAVRTGDWSQALALAGPGDQRIAYATAAVAATADPERALTLAKRAWKQDRSFVPAALAYAERLRKAGKESRAQSVLAETWTQSPHPALGACALAAITPALGSEGLAQVSAAPRLVAGAPAHAESHLLLARVTLAAGLTGEARRHAEAARQAGMNQKRLWLLIADLEAREHGDSAAGQTAQRDALLHAAAADPDPAWRCEACGAAQETWQPACPACHMPGRLRWGSPARLALTASSGR